MNKKYKLFYRIARITNPIKYMGTMGETWATGKVCIFSEVVDGANILKRMKEIEIEHNTNVRRSNPPQFAQFFPIQEIT